VLLISQYRKHEELFRNVNCKKKSVWELRAKENPRESGNHRHSIFASVVTTAVLREMTERKSRFLVEEKALKEKKGIEVKKRILTMASGMQRRKEEGKKMDFVTSLSPRFWLLKLLKRKSADFLV